jgi:hypothetical protein
MVALHLIYHKMYLPVKRFFGQFAFSFVATGHGWGNTNGSAMEADCKTFF